MSQYIEATAEGQGYYHVFIDGIAHTKHLAEREALESAGKAKRDNPESKVYYVHDYRVRIDLVAKPVAIDPVPEPEPPIPTGRIKADDFELIGGWVLNQDFARGGLAIDFTTMAAYSGGHAHHTKINHYQLGAMGQGSDMASWPIIAKSSVIEAFWPPIGGSEGVNYGAMQLRDGVLWVCPRGWYTNGDSNPLIVSGLNLTTGEIERRTIPVSTQAFGGGFIKGHPTDWIVGAGGYISGQSSVAGPTAVTINGEVLLSQVDFSILDFDRREKRPPTSWPKTGVDNFMAFNPRNGVGAWGADSVTGGGIWTDRGVCYWPNLGTGEAEYRDAAVRFTGGYVPWLCAFDTDWKNPAWSEWTHGPIASSEIGPDGLVYMLSLNARKLNEFVTAPAIKVFRVKK
jgi:hypothetical protein